MDDEFQGDLLHFQLFFALLFAAVAKDDTLEYFFPFLFS